MTLPPDSGNEPSRFAKSDRELLVFVHGYSDRASSWSLIQRRLESLGWSTLATTLTPASPLAKDDNLLERYAAQVADKIAAESSKRAIGEVIVVGHSMGSQIAELAVDMMRVHSIKGLVLVTPAPLGGYPLTPSEMQRFRDGAAQSDYSAIRAIRKALSPAMYDMGLEALVRASQETPLAFALEQLEAWTTGHPAGCRQSTVRAPVMVIGAACDSFFTPDFVRMQILPRFTSPIFHLLDRSGHWPHVEHPEAISDLVDGSARSQLATDQS